MLIKNISSSRIDIKQKGIERTIHVGETVDLPAKFLESGIGKNLIKLKKLRKIVIIERKTQPPPADSGKKSKQRK